MAPFFKLLGLGAGSCFTRISSSPALLRRSPSLTILQRPKRVIKALLLPPTPTTSILPLPVGTGFWSSGKSMDRQGPGRPPPQRKELQGPRPAPLRVRKNPSKFKKPPPGPSAPHLPAEEDCPRAGPVIIYAVSPKIIQVTTDDFMSVVQRLTGPSPGPSPRTPAGRFGSGEGMGDFGLPPEVEIEMDTLLDRKEEGNPHGILSPLPSCLPPISPNFFPLPSSLPPFSPNFLSNPCISPNFCVPSPDRELSALLSNLSPTFYGRLSPLPLILSPGMTTDRFLD
ncbi:protein MKS1-like [Nymphaea colorata]|nr:protein MKS1-like [Nymphaea colorata]